MKYRKLTDSLKNAVGTVFLLAGAFFVCSTLVSIRAVFADPIAPAVVSNPAGAKSPRATNSPRGNASNTVNRATNTTSVVTGRSARANASRAVQTRTAVATARPMASVTNNNGASRAATRLNPNATRATTTRVATSRGAAATTRGTATRNVVARTATSRGATRNVISRTAVTPGSDARVSLQGSAIRGSKRGNGTSSYSYLTNKLYTGDYSNIVDSQTGLISAEAYSNCLESYYTCMDEICTARNASQGRCSCANRTKAFQDAENALERANEELITVSGELALLIATKGKDVSKAFQLTDAEKIMNCAAYVEMVADASNKNSSVTNADVEEWCMEHPEYTDNGSISYCSVGSAPTYCETMGNTYDFNLSDLGGSGSDILASLRSWAKAKDSAKNMLVSDDTNLFEQYTGVMNVVSGMGVIDVSTGDDSNDLDKLSNTWGYDLFEYAHNNVCSRVLDSCFNGIYEACGNPPTGGRCATSAKSSCPYNYNSAIFVSEAGDVELVDRAEASTTHASSNSASCFGYSTTSDPYQHLRGPVADARRSVMQKYLLDANAACDVYGEQLRTMAQNIGYQKVAAQQSLQQKRLEFDQEEKETTLADAIDAGTNFDNCISEILECYENIAKKNNNWGEARIRTYCAQIAEVPSCYETMICNPSTSQFRAVIDVVDSTDCNNHAKYEHNTCRNVVTLNEILNGASNTPANVPLNGTGSSADMREQCLRDAGIEQIRKWNRTTADEVNCTLAELRKIDQYADTGRRPKDGTATDCMITSCVDGYNLDAENNRCVFIEKDCTSTIENATSALLKQDENNVVRCIVQSCKAGYEVSVNQCVFIEKDCTSQIENATSALLKQGEDNVERCIVQSCKAGYKVSDNQYACECGELSIVHNGTCTDIIESGLLSSAYLVNNGNVEYYKGGANAPNVEGCPTDTERQDYKDVWDIVDADGGDQSTSWSSESTKEAAKHLVEMMLSYDAKYPNCTP